MEYRISHGALIFEAVRTGLGLFIFVGCILWIFTSSSEFSQQLIAGMLGGGSLLASWWRLNRPFSIIANKDMIILTSFRSTNRYTPDSVVSVTVYKSIGTVSLTGDDGATFKSFMGIDEIEKLASVLQRACPTGMVNIF